MVDLPDADRPVNQIVKPGCLRSEVRSARDSDACQVMLLLPCEYVWRGMAGHLTLPFWRVWVCFEVFWRYFLGGMGE